MMQELSSHSLPHWLTKRADLTPDRPALLAEGVQWSFRELHERARTTAGKLAALGIQKGDRVGVLMHNRPEMVQLVHALSYLEAVLVPLNIRLSPMEAGWQIQNAEAKVTVYDGTNRKTAQRIREIDGALALLAWEELEQQQPVDFQPPVRVGLDSLHTIMYTSGTTGKPKGVMLTYGNHWWSAVGSVLNLGLQPDDRWLICVPLFHMSGLSILMRSVIYGMTAVLHSSFEPSAANRAIREEGITHMSVVSAMLTRMVEDLGDECYPASFRCMLLGGGPAPRPLLEQCKEKGIPVFQTYGMTETASQIVTLAPEDALSKLGSAGKPLYPAELRILRDGREVPPGSEGEIVVRGPNVTRGYWRREDASREAIRDGWLHTGDLGRMDEEGFLYVLDRRSDLIISGGENIYPAEVEAALLAHPAVAEAGVTGLPDERWGQVPAAIVRLQEGAQVAEADLVKHCRERLAKYKVPVRIHQVGQPLPRNASNKLLRRKLAELLPKGEC
jgi:o-succinylbenzoate---CoA ligase